MNMFKRFVAFAIAVVMICGMLPVSAMAAGTHTHDHSAHSDIQPFTSTADLIAQVQAQLVKEGAYGAEEVDQELVAAVEEMSGTAYNQAATTLALGFFNDRDGSEGRIDTANLNLDEETMSSLVENTLKDYYLDGIVEVDYVVKYGVVDAVKFTMRDSFAAGLDQIETGITSMDELSVLAADAMAEAETVVEETETVEEAPAFTGEVSETAPQTAEKKFPFTDVPEWARTAVNWLYQRNIVAGVSATKYGSTQSVTRGQAVTMIWRAMGTPKAEGKNPFKDVKAGQYYTDAVIWAADNGIVAGTSKDTFAPNASVTREQLVAIIYRLAKDFLGMDVSQKASLSAFKDSGRISSYAQEAVKWAVGTKLVSGYTDGTFRPKNVANRAEYAQVLYKFLNMHTHELKAVAAKAATCTENGNSAYWTCSGCGKFYSDAQGKKEIAKDSWVIKATGHKLTETKAKAPTCTEIGNTAYWSCSKCGKYYADSAAKTEIKKDAWIIEANGHKWGEWVSTDKGDLRKCQVCGFEQVCDHSAMANATQATFNWVEAPEYIEVAPGEYGLNPEVFFMDENGYPFMEYAKDEAGNLILDENNQPIPVGAIVVGAYPDGSAIQSLTLVLQKNADTGEFEISVMPTKIPDIYIDWNDVGTYKQNSETEEWELVSKDTDDVMSAPEIAESIEKGGYHTRMAWTVPTADVVCPNCGFAKPVADVTVQQILVDDAYIEQMATQSAMGAMMADEAAMGTFMAVMEQRVPEIMGEIMPGMMEEKMPQYMAQGMTQEEAQAKIQEEAQAQAEAQAQQEAFGAVLQNHPNVYAAMNQTIGQLSGDYHSVLYTATVTLSEQNSISDTMNATAVYLGRTWANMCNFNEVYAKYFGAATPYWTTKNEEEGPMAAFKYVLNMQEEPVIPNFIMEYYMSMLTQAFMSYVQSYAPALDAMLADAMATVNHDELDELDIMLLMHDWLAAYGEFDMQSLVDQQTGASAGSDPITMTAFGTLLHEQLGIDGAVCLGYAATYALLLQHAFDKVTTEDPVVDFVMIKYLTNVAESSIAAGESGFGDGDAMFNAPHFLNAVEYKGNWYYIDACYDDINSEVISQERVETDGNVSHNSFLLAPATWEDMYDGNFQLMDSLYDGKDWFRVPDGQGGYKMQDNKGNVYTEQAAKDAKDADNTLQIFYVYEPHEDTKETRYEDTTYEMAWFAGIEGAVTYDPETQYFYYTAGAITNYASMKDMFGEDGEEDDSMSMDQADMMEYKNAPNAQDKIVRRPVDAENEPEEAQTNNGMTMGAPADDECEVLFHFGYGSTGAQAHAKYESDSENNNMNNGGITDADKGAWYAETQDDMVYMTNYPEIAHSTVMIDGNLYFNMGNAIYTFNYSVDQMAANAIEAIETLELVKVKEYDKVTFTVNYPADEKEGPGRFLGKQYVTSNSGTTVYYRPICGLSVHTDFIPGRDANGQTTVTAVDTLHVSVATNFSNSYTPDDAAAYAVEARNYNPDYYRFMEEEEETTEETNDNVEFMWTASIVDKLAIADFTSELNATSGSRYSAAAYCGRDSFTEQRTSKCGLIVAGTRTVNEDTALDHEFAMDETEGTNICSTCLENHEHDYSYATPDDIDIVWKVNGETLTATAVIPCGNDEFCPEDLVLQPNAEGESTLTVTDNGDGSWTATVKHGTVTKTETKTIDQVNHTVHDYGEPVFTWTENIEEITNEDGTVTTNVAWTAVATFTCEAEEADCVGSDVEEPRTVEVKCSVKADNGHRVATAEFEGRTYTDTLHIYNLDQVTAEPDAGKDNVTVTYQCAACSYKRVITAAITETVEGVQDCDSPGKVTYTATVKADAVYEGTEGQTDNAVPEYTYTDVENFEALGHDYEDTYDWDEANHASCVVTLTCKREGCGHITTADAEISDLVTKEATCTEAGSKIYTATVEVDGKTFTDDETVETPVIPHTEEVIPGVAATCTNTGLSDGIKCSACGEILTAQVVTPMIAHTEENIPGKAATCTETGLTDGVKCSVCGEILTAQEEIPVIEHNYVDGICTGCGTTEPVTPPEEGGEEGDSEGGEG